MIVRWLAPAGLFVTLVARSWPIAVGALAILVLAWLVRLRQYPRIAQGEMGIGSPPSPRRPAPGPEYMRPYYETWLGVGDFGGKHGELWEVRARNAVDKNLYDGASHNVAIAVLLPPENSWNLVNAHIDALPPWEGRERIRSEMQVALPD